MSPATTRTSDPVRPEAHVRITCTAWRDVHTDLARRGDGCRESGAFLLARPGSHRVRAWIAFDELDPDCLVGSISFAPAGFSRLWRLCACHRLAIVADIHTHPGLRTAQSHIDATNPMIATPGHIALISPNFAATVPRPDQVGVHVLLGSRRWHVPPPRDRAQVLRIHPRTWATRELTMGDIPAAATPQSTRRR